MTSTNTIDTTNTSRLAPAASDMCMKNSTTSVALMVAIDHREEDVHAPRSIRPVQTVSAVKTSRIAQTVK